MCLNPPLKAIPDGSLIKPTLPHPPHNHRLFAALTRPRHPHRCFAGDWQCPICLNDGQVPASVEVMKMCCAPSAECSDAEDQGTGEDDKTLAVVLGRELGDCWEVASIVHFFSIFKRRLGLMCEVDGCELERELASKRAVYSPLLASLHMCLLRGLRLSQSYPLSTPPSSPRISHHFTAARLPAFVITLQRQPLCHWRHPLFRCPSVSQPLQTHAFHDLARPVPRSNC